MRIQPSRGRRHWTKAKVLKKVAPRSYTVQTEAGSILRRNRRQLRTSPGEVLDNANPQERCEYSYEENAEGPEVREEQEWSSGEEELEESETGRAEELEEQQRTTRNGRPVRRPAWLSDYVS